MADAALLYGVFTRGLSVIYVIAFFWIRREVIALAGRRGITPVADVLRAARRDFGRRAWLYFPTLLWMSASDRSLRSLSWLGTIAAALSILGGPLSPVGLLVAWLVYLSFDVALDLRYPWECLLLEAGALSLLLPAAEWLPSISLFAEPSPLVQLAFAWLLFRVVFGFGKLKFFGPGKLHSTYLEGFAIDQPIPGPAAHLISAARPWALRAMLAGLFCVEVIAPFFVLVGPAELRAVAILAIVALMCAIWLSGNYGFFNLLVILLCCPVLAAGDDPLLSALASLDLKLTSLLAIAYMLAGLVFLPFNSWVTQAWTHWHWFSRKAPFPIRAITAAFRVVQPLRLVHAYGVFTPQSGPPVRWVPVIEGTQDGKEWSPYVYRYVPTTEQSPLRMIAPGMPRLDHFTIYEGYGLRMSGLYASVFGTNNPYLQSEVPFVRRLVQRLLEGNPEVESLFLRTPFDGPATAIRVRLFAFEPGSGRGWTKQLVHEHLEVTRSEPSLFESWLPRIDALHFDDAVWRSRAIAPSKPGALPSVLSDLELTPHAASLRRDAARVTAAKARWADVAAHVTEAGFEPAMEQLGMLVRPDAPGEDGAQLGFAAYAAFHPEEVLLLCRTARLMELTLRGAVADPPPIAPAFLKWLPLLAGRYEDAALEWHPRFARRDGRWVRIDGKPGHPTPFHGRGCAMKKPHICSRASSVSEIGPSESR